jgi:hypothetical protein
MHDFERYNIGKCFDFNSVNIADIEAEFLRIPKYICHHWFKKSVLMFIFNTILNDNPNELFRYIFTNKNDLIINILEAEDVLSDYQTSLSMCTLHTKMVAEKDYLDKTFSGVVEALKKNVREAEVVANKLNLDSSYVKNSGLLNRKNTFILNKSMINKSDKLLQYSTERQDLFEDIQINKLYVEPIEYNELLEEAQSYMSSSLTTLIDHEEEYKLDAFIKTACKFAKTDRIVLLSEFIKSDHVLGINKSMKKPVTNLAHFIEGVE